MNVHNHVVAFVPPPSEMSAQLSRVSHTLSAIFPGHPDEPVGRTVIELHTSVRPAPELHVRVRPPPPHTGRRVSVGGSSVAPSRSPSCPQAVNLILRSFCRCVLEASRGNAPSK